MYGLDGRRALVTGGAAGIGRAIAVRLAREGCDVAILDRDDAGATVAEVRAAGRLAASARGDVGEEHEVRIAVGNLERELGVFDILVNNAGISRLGGVLDTSLEDWRRSFKVNVDGCFFCSRTVVPGMVARGRGAVVNLSSWLGKVVMKPFGTYSATKFAVIAMTQSLALEVAGKGVRVNAICPGIVGDTPMREDMERIGAEFGLPPAASRVAGIPLGRLGTVDDVADLTAFLVSDQASYMTGLAIPVAGGSWLL